MGQFIFRVESSNKEGMGHFYRCLSLARILSGYHIVFLMILSLSILESLLK